MERHGLFYIFTLFIVIQGDLPIWQEYNGTCYTIIENTTTLDGAEQACRQIAYLDENLTVAVPAVPTQLDYLRTVVLADNSVNYWVWLQRSTSRGDYIWGDNSSFNLNSEWLRPPRNLSYVRLTWGRPATREYSGFYFEDVNYESTNLVLCQKPAYLDQAYGYIQLNVQRKRYFCEGAEYMNFNHWKCYNVCSSARDCIGAQYNPQDKTCKHFYYDTNCSVTYKHPLYVNVRQQTRCNHFLASIY